METKSLLRVHMNFEVNDLEIEEFMMYLILYFLGSLGSSQPSHGIHGTNRVVVSLQTQDTQQD